jgi:hypothetical protein
MADHPGAPFGDSEPLFYDVSPKWTWVVRITGIIALLMVVLAFIFCIVRAETQHNLYFYLLACNIIMSFLLGSVNAWWYRNGHLSADKYWFLLTVAVVIIWQCIATDIYVFHLPSPVFNTSTTSSPLTTGLESIVPITTTTPAKLF